MVPDEASEDLQNQNIDRWLMKSMIDEALAGLSERDAYVIRLRFGLIDDRQHTLEEIGKTMGLTRGEDSTDRKEDVGEASASLGAEERRGFSAFQPR